MNNSHRIIKIFHKNGLTETGTLIQKSQTEITIWKNNKMQTLQMKHIKKISDLALMKEKPRRDVKKPREKIATCTKATSKSFKKNTEKQKYLYLMSLGNNFYKIGFSGNVQKRLKYFKTSSPYKIELITTKKFNAQNIHEKENDLIQLFKEKFNRSDGGNEVFSIPSGKHALKAFMSIF